MERMLPDRLGDGWVTASTARVWRVLPCAEKAPTDGYSRCPLVDAAARLRASDGHPSAVGEGPARVTASSWRSIRAAESMRWSRFAQTVPSGASSIRRWRRWSSLPGSSATVGGCTRAIVRIRFRDAKVDALSAPPLGYERAPKWLIKMSLQIESPS
jgi:hypothetical protein